METLFIILTIWLAPIILIILMLYLMMEKGQTVEDFVFQYDLDDSSFWGPLLIPGANYFVCIVVLAHFIYESLKHWKK